MKLLYITYATASLLSGNSVIRHIIDFFPGGDIIHMGILSLGGYYPYGDIIHMGISSIWGYHPYGDIISIWGVCLMTPLPYIYDTEKYTCMHRLIAAHKLIWENL